jgi:glycosyltransferase involved in cell wall biosynthesis
MDPIVTVVIPTANRPRFLPRAIDSALAGMVKGTVEVIVVPNGTDQSWKTSLLPYRNNAAVRVKPLSEPNANRARNVGLDAARGELIRFLDDDDILIPKGATKQYEKLKSSDADVISGAVQLINSKGDHFDIWYQPTIDDFCAAVIGPWRRCLPTAHVFKKFLLKDIYWNPKTKVRQDVEWMIDLGTAKEIRWLKCDDIVGTWQHHWGGRISSSYKHDEIRRLTVSMILKGYIDLTENGRMTHLRRRAVALGLWGCVQTAFFLDPKYWSKIARLAQAIDSNARPEPMLYHLPILKNLDPLTIQILMLPKRVLSFCSQQLLNRLRVNHNW